MAIRLIAGKHYEDKSCSIFLKMLCLVQKQEHYYVQKYPRKFARLASNRLDYYKDFNILMRTKALKLLKW
jgi:hypothetical protein